MSLRPSLRRKRNAEAVRRACAPVLETLEGRQLLTVIFYEDFNSLAWQNSREEGPQSGQGTAGENVWTNVPPTGWAKDDTGVPGYNNPDLPWDPNADPPVQAGREDNNGITEWIGWTFPKVDWWKVTAGDQRRSEFTNASGGIMVADNDEWDDAPHPGKGSWLENELYNAKITSPSVSLANVTGPVTLDFDSSWRPEGFDDNAEGVPPVNNQTGIINVVFSDGTRREIMHWDSDPTGPFFHDHLPNEHVTLPIGDVPAGATSFKLEFLETKSANDWWWAVDNVAVQGNKTFPGTRLIGITDNQGGAAAGNDETLWDITYGATFNATKIVKLPSVPDDVAIGFNSATGLLHHTAGDESYSDDPADKGFRDNQFMETVDVVANTNATHAIFNANSEQFGPVAPRPTWVEPATRRTDAQTDASFRARGPNEYHSAGDLAWSDSAQAFFVADANGIFKLTPGGQSTFIGDPSTGQGGPRGISFFTMNGQRRLLIGVAEGADLFTIDPATGALVGDSVQIADDQGQSSPGILALEESPDGSQLLAISRDPAAPNDALHRLLIQIDPTTGRYTTLGRFNVQMSGLAFVYPTAAASAQVSEVYVRGSAWSAAFKTYMAGQGLGDGSLGYRVDNKPANDIVPWVNLDEIVVRYSAAPSGSGIPTPGTLVLDGVRSDLTVSSVSALDPQTYVLRLDRPLGNLPAGGGENGDRIKLTVPGGGAAGANYVRTINVLQGDVDKSGSVVASDFSDVKKKFFKSTANPGAGDTGYTVFHDPDGSGSIVANDFSEVKKRFFDNLPPAGASTASVSGASITSDLFRVKTVLA